MKKIIYSLGTSNRTLEQFLHLLKTYRISQVVDVRRWPTSKHFEHFKKENLQKFLKQNKINYFHLENLGGYRTGGYKAYIKTKQFKQDLKKLINIAQKSPTAIVCAEKLPWKCHRAYIAQQLKKINFQIIHILEKDKIWQSKTEKKQIKPTCEKIILKKQQLREKIWNLPNTK